MELNANVQLAMNSFGILFPDKIFSLTCFKFPDISRFSRQVITLVVVAAAKAVVIVVATTTTTFTKINKIK